MSEFGSEILGIATLVGLLWSAVLTGAILDIRSTLNRIEKILREKNPN